MKLQKLALATAVAVALVGCGNSSSSSGGSSGSETPVDGNVPPNEEVTVDAEGDAVAVTPSTVEGTLQISNAKSVSINELTIKPSGQLIIE